MTPLTEENYSWCLTNWEWQARWILRCDTDPAWQADLRACVSSFDRARPDTAELDALVASIEAGGHDRGPNPFACRAIENLPSFDTLRFSLTPGQTVHSLRIENPFG